MQTAKTLTRLRILVLLAFCAGPVAAQQQVTAVQPYQNELVAGCDTFSQVTRTTMKMQVAEKRLPAPEERGAETRYRLGAGKTGTTRVAGAGPVTFAFSKEPGNRMGVWLEGKEKHCFGLQPGVSYSFKTYDLTDKSLEVYGRMYWGQRHWRNFRVIFYIKPAERDVLFDLDDDTRLMK